MAMTSGGRISAVEYLNAIRLIGVDFTIKKPFRDEYLLNAIHSILYQDGNYLKWNNIYKKFTKYLFKLLHK